jgi:plastocyanin
MARLPHASRLLRALALAAVVGAAVNIAVMAAQGRQGHDPRLVFVSGEEAQDGDWSWADAPKGDLEGKLAFSARRPSQPLVVHLLRVDGQDEPAAQGRHAVPGKLNVSQKGARFEPSFAVLVRGQTVEFLNDEEREISHNVYFLGAVEADLGIFERDESRSHTFGRWGEVSVHCSIHRRMDARLFVAPNPAYAVIEGDAAEFTIRDVPAGRYRLMTWQKQKRFRDASQVVEIKAGETARVTVEMTR